MKQMMFMVLVGLLSALEAFAATPSSLSQVFPEGEKMVFSRLVASYRKQDLNEVVKQQQALAKNYPSSLYTDQATYLRGYLELEKGRYAEALKAFSAIENKRPYSVKRPDALFAKAMTYKKLDLPKQADFVLKKLEKSYPGSPESRRAALERRLLRVK
jgi:TolA-binding protein